MATVERDVRCSAADVLEVLADGWSYATWVVGTSRIRGVDATWPAAGARLAHSAGIWPAVINDETVSCGWDPEGWIELQARGWPAGEARVRIEVESRGPDRCVVRLAEDAVRGPGAFVPKPLRTAAIVPRNKETLRRLAMLAEGRSAQQAGPAT